MHEGGLRSNAVFLFSLQKDLNCRTWWRFLMFLIKCKSANCQWDCSKCVLFILLCRWCDVPQKLSFLSRSWHFLRSLTVSVCKWKARRQWWFSPAVMLMYPNAAPTVLWFCDFYEMFNFCGRTFCVPFSFENNVSSSALMSPLWYGCPHVARLIWGVWQISGGRWDKNDGKQNRWTKASHSHYFGNKLPTQHAKGCQSKCHAPVCRMCM